MDLSKLTEERKKKEFQKRVKECEAKAEELIKSLEDMNYGMALGAIDIAKAILQEKAKEYIQEKPMKEIYVQPQDKESI